MQKNFSSLTLFILVPACGRRFECSFTTDSTIEECVKMMKDLLQSDLGGMFVITKSSGLYDPQNDVFLPAAISLSDMGLHPYMTLWLV